MNTKPELIVRSGLHAMGFRFRTHVRGLPGTPDLALRRFKAAVFVHGCFWHGHNCRLFKMPSTRREFWEEKISGNRMRDCNAVNALRALGWRVLIVWECALKGTGVTGIQRAVSSASEWIKGHSMFSEIASPDNPHGLITST